MQYKRQPDQIPIMRSGENMLDKSFERYIDYLRKLKEDKFCGRVTVEFYKGGISKIRNKIFDPIMIKEEDIILKETKR